MTKQAAYRQDVTITLPVIVTAAEDEFDMDVDALRERIELFVKRLLPANVYPFVTEVYARRGPSGSQYFPAAVSAFGTGKMVALDRLPEV